MTRVRTRIAVTGFTEHEAREGVPHLLEEFGQRPWLLACDARWEAAGSKVTVTVESEGGSLALQGGTAGAHLDEVRDCVIACLNFTSEGIHFEVEEATLVGAGDASGPSS